MHSPPLYNLLSYVKQNHLFILYCLGISLVAFAFEILNVSISVDEEIASLSEKPLRAWLHMDRWGMYVLNWLLQDGPPLPYINMLVGIIANLLAWLVCLDIWSLKQGNAKYAAAIFALAHPTIAFVYAFNQSQYGYYIGMLLAVIGVWVFIRAENRKVNMLFALALWVGALSIYQSVIFAAPAVYLAYILSQYLYRKNSHSVAVRKSIINLIVFFAALLVAVAAHEVISFWIRTTLQIDGRYHTIEQFYSGSFISSYDPLFVIKEVFAQLIGHRWYVGYLTGGILGLSVLFILRSIRQILESRVQVLTTVLLLGSIVSPFIFVILTSRFWPARTMMALPIMTAGIIYLGLQQIPRGPRRWMSIMAVLCYFGFVQSNTKLFYSDYVTWQNDKLLANRIVAAVESKFGDLLVDNPLPIVFIGHPTRSSLPIQKREEHFGGSVLEWDRGSNHRILALFRLIGCDYFTLANTAQINQAKGEATEMPVWPASASISMVDEIIVVKFSEVADEH